MAYFPEGCSNQQGWAVTVAEMQQDELNLIHSLISQGDTEAEKARCKSVAEWATLHAARILPCASNPVLRGLLEFIEAERTLPSYNMTLTLFNERGGGL